MKLFVFLLILSSQPDSTIVGNYTYGNGLNFEYLELTPEDKFKRGSFADIGVNRGFRTIGTFDFRKDTVFLTYKTKRLERIYHKQLGSRMIYKKSDTFDALVPVAEIDNWEKYLTEIEESKIEVQKLCKCCRVFPPDKASPD